jgi:hypothetical protein
MQRKNPYLPYAVQSTLRLVDDAHHHLHMAMTHATIFVAVVAGAWTFCEKIAVKSR